MSTQEYVLQRRRFHGLPSNWSKPFNTVMSSFRTINNISINSRILLHLKEIMNTWFLEFSLPGETGIYNDIKSYQKVPAGGHF